ncbi:MAG: motility associated factor glycosyltransferase family protein [Phycisphaeraceae bacterium]|nr:motility associated factor glycosyltransferase family protein [Phycisphaeraceae bacterium]
MADIVTEILRANLAAIAQRHPDLAQRIERASAASLTWSESKAGPLTACMDWQGRSISLASRYDPMAEADKLLADLDRASTACVVLLGLGLGYHAQRVAQTLGKGVLIVFEPDVTLWRAVLERIDHSRWLGAKSVVLGDDQLDTPRLTKRLEGFAGMVTQGTKIITHPPSRQRCADAFKRFSQTVTETLAFCRTNVATALVNSARTCSNLAGNLAHYAAGSTTDDLHRVATGYPAVCVGAGPSLVKNIDLLRDPVVRRNIVLISAQTTLKPLLARGIYPDFVTALDYSQISVRFYEDLPPLPGVTLVAEPKVHPAVLDAFPGPVRLTANKFNDQLLGPLASPRINIRPGATVAHLSVYLAEHLGCDPIIMIGQDLGFSDGLYYCPGTAAWNVWSSELNPFNSIEMMEWQRIARHKSHLRKLEDVNGRPIYSDEQMITYLRQFERDFAETSATIIDATEGGLPKSHTQRMTLADALHQYATRPLPHLPPAAMSLDLRKLEQLRELVQKRVRQVHEIRSTSKQTIPILRQMLEHQRDQVRMNKLFERLNANTRKVEGELGEAFALINHVNMIGAFKRIKADRAIEHQGGNELDRQASRIERDIANIELLIEACDETLRIFEEARTRLDKACQQLTQVQAA